MDSLAAVPPDVAAFAASGVSVTVASRDDRLVPSIAKGVACRVDAGGERVTVFVFASGAETLLHDVARSGRVALTLSRPSNHQTVQIKGRDARVESPQPQDYAFARRCLALFCDDLARLGWDARFVESAFWHEPGELLAVIFTPEHAFQQTPGPAAGRPLGAPPLPASGG